MHKDFDTFVLEAKRYSAQNLLETANDWISDGWDEEEKGAPFAPFTESDFIDNLYPTSINILDYSGEDAELPEERDFSIDFEAGDMFWGHNVFVEGVISEDSFQYKNSRIWG